MSSNFDDIKSLLDDVLSDKPVTEPEVEATPPEVVQETVAAIASSTSDEDILGDLLAEIQAEEAASVITPPAVDSVEAIEAGVTKVCKPTEEIEGAIQAVAATVTEEELEQVSEISEHVFAEPIDKDVIQLPTFTTDEIAEELDIRNFATLVTLNTARWHAKVKDRAAAKAAADAAGATPEAFEARKLLLAGCDQELKAVHKEIDNARTEHYRLTMPWSSVGVNDVGKRSGGRLMPNTLFLDYCSAMAKAKQSMEIKLDIFVKKYPSLLAVVQQKLGTAYDPAQYPNPSSIATHFNLSFDFNPIPVGSDFKGLQEAQTEKLGAALNRKTRMMLENAMQDAWKTLYDSVSHAAAVLAEPGKMFHKTLIEKLVSQAELLSHLNATKDAGIEEIRVALVASSLTKFDPKDIRKDAALRKRLSEEAKVIAERMEEIANA